MTSFFLQPLPLAPSAFTFNSGPPATVANLGDPQPKLVWAPGTPATAWGPLSFEVDLGADTSFDTAALLYHTGGTGWWRAYGRTEAQGPFAPGDIAGAAVIFAASSWRMVAEEFAPRTHVVWGGSATIARYLRFQVYSPDATNANWTAGVLAIGTRFTPGTAIGLAGIDWGMGRRVQDLSEIRVLDGGERGIWKKAKVPEVRGTFSNLSDGELRRWWSMLSAVGESGPLLFVEDAAWSSGRHDRIHYGTLTGLDFYERRQANKSRIDFRLTHWL